MKDIFLVDADDTILDFHGASALAIRSAFESSGIAWEDRFSSVFKTLNDGLWEALERKEITRKELIAKRFPLYLETLGITSVQGDAFNRMYLQYLATHPIYVDGAENFLTELNKLGRVFIVTNGTEFIQRSRFDIAKLWGYAEDVFISDTIGFDKPAKGYTEYVVSHIPDFQIERAVWIGDSLSADISAANAAGITSIWFNPKRKPLTNSAKPDYNFGKFEEILQILQKINGK